MRVPRSFVFLCLVTWGVACGPGETPVAASPDTAPDNSSNNSSAASKPSAASTPSTTSNSAPLPPPPDVKPSNIKSDEVAVFIPTFATRRGDTWTLPIEPWVYEPEDDGLVRRAALKAVEELVEIKKSDATADRLVSSMRPFLVDNEGGKHVVVQWGSQAAEVCETEGDGRCHGSVSLTQDAAKALTAGRAGVPTVQFRTVLRRDDTRSFGGEVQLLEDEGVSVISDIDDTIKITACHDKKELLKNTLLRDFREAPGVAALYQTWAKQGAAFHYVSNSPLPLLGAITRFIDSAGFPRGAVQLKPFRWKDGSFLDLLAAPEDHKQRVLEELIGRFDKRRFILVGDTGERDPEIYAAIARSFPGRIIKIYVRDPRAATPGLETRLDAAFEGLPRSLWQVFVDGSDITDAVPGS